MRLWAGSRLNLDGGVGDAEFVAQQGLQAGQDSIRIAAFNKLCVQCRHAPTTRQLPYMQVVNSADTVNTGLKAPRERIDINALGHAFEQDVQTVLQ